MVSSDSENCPFKNSTVFFSRKSYQHTIALITLNTYNQDWKILLFSTNQEHSLVLEPHTSKCYGIFTHQTSNYREWNVEMGYVFHIKDFSMKGCVWCIFKEFARRFSSFRTSFFISRLILIISSILETSIENTCEWKHQTTERSLQKICQF